MSPMKRRILCVESHADTRLMLTTVLGLFDYQIVSAQTVTDGVSLARSQRCDLYLLGDRYQDGTNIDLCRQLRVFDPNTPIVIYSTGIRTSEHHQALRAGAQEYVSKPGDIIQLMEMICRLVEREESSAKLAGV